MAEKPNLARTLRWLKARPWIQAGFLVVWLEPYMFRFCGPVFHCYACPLATFACPIGIIANFSYFHLIPFMAIGTILVVGAAVGAVICGWVCPFGFLQDLAARVRTPKLRLPYWAGYTRYAVLVGLVLLVPFFLGESHPLFICRVCPAGALEGAVPNVVKSAIAGTAIAWPSAAKFVILGAFLVGMFFVWRPWCTLFCPLGAIYGLSNHLSVFFLKFHPNRCTDCLACRNMCHYGASPGKRANDPRCIRCLECTRCGAIEVASVLKPKA